MADAGEWAGKAAVVTGAAGGIGRAVVATLLAGGARVVAFDASATALEAARGAWRAGDRVTPVVGDVSSAVDVRGAFAAAAALEVPLGALAACAGIYTRYNVDELSDDEWHRVLRVNLKGVFLCCQAAARLMVPRGAGAMITMASSIAYCGMAGRTHYGASKMAVAAFTRALAVELGPHGIRANALAPGSIDTPMPRSLGGRTEEEVQQTLRANPLGQVGTPEDVANLIAFLLSERSRHISGEVVHITAAEYRL